MAEVVRTRRGSATTVYAAFEQVARRYPAQVALSADGGRGRSFTYSEVLSLVKQLSKGLTCSKYSRTELVGILSENRPEWGITYLAILAAGRTVVPIDPYLKEDEITFIIKDAGLPVIFVSGRFEELLKKLYPAVKVFSFEKDSPHSWRALRNAENQVGTNSVNETAALIYTSGTTGAPKAVELTHKNILANLDGIASGLTFDHNDTFLSVLPLHHTFEATCGFLTPLMSGATVVYARSLKSKEILEDIAFNGATLMCGVPLLFEKMYHAIRRGIASSPWPKRLVFHLLFLLSSVAWPLGFRWGKSFFRGLRYKAGLGTIRMFVSGGAALPPRIARFFNLIGFDFCQGYGMTECSPVIATNRPGSIRFGSVGPPLSNIEVRIENPASGGVGEILVKGDNVTPGYRNNPGKTTELTVEGWLHTGDLGRLKDGHLWITGRLKNIIVSAAGKNIYPEELEEKLLESRYLLEAVVFGRKKHGKQGEEVRALVVPDLTQIEADFGVTAGSSNVEKVREVISSVVKDVNTQIADYKRIVDFEVQFEELEKTSTKKVKRFLYK